ncbi:MAG: hypothetical protein R6W71_04460, partial [Bacteroidales bacterium]
MVRKTLMVLTFTLASFVTAAQEADFILSDFFAVQVEERVYMRWTIIQGKKDRIRRVPRIAEIINL